MPLNKVNNIRLNEDNTISLDVSVDGFDADSPIEISGDVTQANGAVASFYQVETVPKPISGQETVVTVESVRASSKIGFVATDPITVVARAAEVWITMLATDGEFRTSEAAGVQAAWKMQSFDYAIGEPGQHPSGWK
jgi:hypothetical protein